MPGVQMQCLTATATIHVQDDILASLGMDRKTTEVIVGDCNRSELFYMVRYKEVIAQQHIHKGSDSADESLGSEDNDDDDGTSTSAPGGKRKWQKASNYRPQAHKHKKQRKR